MKCVTKLDKHVTHDLINVDLLLHILYSAETSYSVTYVT